MKLLENVFSIKNVEDKRKNCKHKIITILGIKIKLRNKTEKIKNCVAILDCYGIGDYMMCRPYFQYLRNCPKYKDSFFIFLKNSGYNNIPEIYDDGFFDVIISIPKDLKALKKELDYNYEITTVINLYTLLKQINFIDYCNLHNLVKTLNVKHSIADIITESENDLNNKNLKIYDTCITTKPKYFELERRRQFFENLTQTSIPKTNKKIEPLFDLKQDYICLSLCSNSLNRSYDNKKWIVILNYLIANTPNNMQLVFLGSQKERGKIDNILQNLKSNNKCKNIAGTTTPALLPVLLKGAKCLISVETGTVHIAESVNCPTLCMSCGAYWHRFLPYENTVINYVLPDGFDELLKEDNPEKLTQFYYANYTFTTLDIKPEKVIKYINKYLTMIIDNNNMPETLAHVERERERE